MAIFNELLVGRFNRSLQKLFGIKGHPPVRQLAGEIQPIHSVAAGIELRYLESWNKFWTTTAGIVGAAGQSPTFRFVNPKNSNIIAVIEKLLLGTFAADKIDIQFETNGPAGDLATLGSLLIPVAMDGRFAPQTANPLASQANCIVSTNTNTASVGTLVMKRQSQAGVDIDVVTDEDGQILLTPSSVLNIFSEAAAGTLFVSVVWRERFLEESERI